jgi:hypothetical protein
MQLATKEEQTALVGCIILVYHFLSTCESLMYVKGEMNNTILHIHCNVNNYIRQSWLFLSPKLCSYNILLLRYLLTFVQCSLYCKSMKGMILLNCIEGFISMTTINCKSKSFFYYCLDFKTAQLESLSNKVCYYFCTYLAFFILEFSCCDKFCSDG